MLRQTLTTAYPQPVRKDYNERCFNRKWGSGAGVFWYGWLSTV
jgi:hypothetical protein